MNKRLPVTGLEPVADLKVRSEDIPPPEAYEFEDKHVPVDAGDESVSLESLVFGGRHRPVGNAAFETTVTHAAAVKPKPTFVRSEGSASSTKKARDVRIIDEREQSSMVSCWTIYLCLQQGESERFRAFNGRWSECLGQREEYPYNEETEEYEIPDVINAVRVEAVDDDMILGGNLIWEAATDAVEFGGIESPELHDWLSENKWDLKAIRSCPRAWCMSRESWLD